MNNGKVIAGWRTIPLCDAAEVIMGSSPPGESYNENAQGVPLINGPVEFGDGDFGLTIRRQYTTEPTKFCRAGDLLLCVRGSTTGRTNIAAFEACIGRGVAAIRAKEHQPFLNHFIRTQRQRLFDLGNGSTFPSITQEQLARVKVPLPPLPDQHHIAAILDKADAIRRKRAEGIRLTDELLRSTFLEMFGDPATNSKGWKMAAVEEGLSGERPGMRCGPFGTALRKDEYISEGIPVWGIENVQPNLFLGEGSLFISEDKYSELSAYSVRSGDVLISRAGTVGRMCVARPRQEQSIIGTNLIRVALDQTVIAPDYFTALFTYFADRVAGLRASSDDGAYSFMQTGVLRHVRVPLPPIEKQRAFAKFVEVTRRNQTRRNEGLEASDLLFHSLVSRAFRGEL